MIEITVDKGQTGLALVVASRWECRKRRQRKTPTAPRGRPAVAAYLMDQMARLIQDVGRRIESGDYRVTLADLETAASLHDAPAL
ncbi:hypothetical protein [Bradyrhizobium sp. 138]|uniref:hypothetical protein n=1 Tax=Bradyrhizobium sp. 138 TaxID=2782615 RepID=UPI001FF96267|nr:hypothetical protein [Bradyrhizobium sp. 138]